MLQYKDSFVDKLVFQTEFIIDNLLRPEYLKYTIVIKYDRMFTIFIYHLV